MKLGLGSYAVAWSVGVPGYPVDRPMDALDLVRLAAALGLHLVQIADNLPLHLLAPAQMHTLLNEAQRLDVAMEVGTRGIQPDHLQYYVGLAQQMGSPILRVVIDAHDFHPSPSEAVELIRQLLPHLEMTGITLAIENHDRFRTHALVEMMQTLNTPLVGICLDTVNSFGSLEGPEVVVEALGPYVANLHIKDFRIRRLDHNMGFVIEGAPAGQGMLNVPWLLHRLKTLAAGRPVNAILETWPPLQTTLQDTVALEQQWVVESVDYLRRLIPDQDAYGQTN